MEIVKIALEIKIVKIIQEYEKIMAEPTIKIFEGKTIESIERNIPNFEYEEYVIKFTDGNVLKINSYSEEEHGSSGLAWEIDVH